ncbi:MAG: hypothetical protein IOC80_10440 [Rhodobacter sp.]|nr:hypothetical protein [Rhodobacter sp.]MCA3513523.1 hypothetical protein [Rhodobacter sp.]MCA3521174.1 hypothetical protein [Rhodobacter sp.]MCA3523970.1 hypothetical protein [Rhodobacter sp.]MCA3525058.1 hypothetical protein [Rhodobacter sp.]
MTQHQPDRSRVMQAVYLRGQPGMKISIKKTLPGSDTSGTMLPKGALSVTPAMAGPMTV